MRRSAVRDPQQGIPFSCIQVGLPTSLSGASPDRLVGPSNLPSVCSSTPRENLL